MSGEPFKRALRVLYFFRACINGPVRVLCKPRVIFLKQMTLISMKRLCLNWDRIHLRELHASIIGQVVRILCRRLSEYIT